MRLAKPLLIATVLSLSLSGCLESRMHLTDDFGSAGRAFNGRIRWVELDIDEAAEDVDHLITPEERLRIAMARQ